MLLVASRAEWDAPNLLPFAIAPLDPVEKLSGLFLGKHHADIAGRNPRRTLLSRIIDVVWYLVVAAGTVYVAGFGNDVV